MSEVHHVVGVPKCPLCEEKLKEAHPIFIKYWPRIKVKFMNAHISWSYRDEENQNKAFASGKSKLEYPHSPHNFTKPDGTPEAHAIDLFELTDKNVALFPNPFDKALKDPFYEKVSEFLVSIVAPIVWSGTWKHFKGDLDHYQLDLSKIKLCKDINGTLANKDVE